MGRVRVQFHKRIDTEIESQIDMTLNDVANQLDLNQPAHQGRLVAFVDGQYVENLDTKLGSAEHVIFVPRWPVTGG